MEEKLFFLGGGIGSTSPVTEGLIKYKKVNLSSIEKEGRENLS